MKAQPVYVFSEDELARMLTIAKVKARADNAGSHTQHRAPKGVKRGTKEYFQHQTGTWRRGLAGEIAFCRLFHLPPVQEAGCWEQHGSTDHDVHLEDGRKVEVKTRTYQGGDLLVPKDNNRKRVGQSALQRLEADLYVNCHAAPPNIVVLEGWATRETFVEHVHLANYGSGPCFALRPGMLQPMSTLLPPHRVSPLTDPCDFCGRPPPGIVHLEPQGWVCLTCYVNRTARRMQMP